MAARTPRRPRRAIVPSSGAPVSGYYNFCGHCGRRNCPEVTVHADGTVVITDVAQKIHGLRLEKDEAELLAGILAHHGVIAVLPKD